jgi:hypothetical protein
MLFLMLCLNPLTFFDSKSSVANKNPNVRKTGSLPTPLAKRQRQPSLDQFLPSHDLVGVWLPAASSKRAKAKAVAKVSAELPIHRAPVTLECARCPPSPPREQHASQQPQDHFSLTLSLGSNTEDECFINHEQEQQYEPQLGQHRHEQWTDQQQSCLPTLQVEPTFGHFVPELTVLPERHAAPTEVAGSVFASDRRPTSAGSPLLNSSSSSACIHASQSLFSLSSPPSIFSALSSNSSFSSSHGSSNAAHYPLSSCHQLSPPHSNQCDDSHPQSTMLPYASGQVVPGAVTSYLCYTAVPCLTRCF